MSIIDYLCHEKKDTATIARERLQIIFAHERGKEHRPEYLPKMQQEILDVVKKYVPINQDQVDMQIDQNGRYCVLELNIVLNEDEDEE